MVVFDFIYNADGSCHQWDCGEPGVVLAYDVMQPECGHWFCETHWEPYEESDVQLLTIAEDKREKYVSPLAPSDQQIEAMFARYTQGEAKENGAFFTYDDLQTIRREIREKLGVLDEDMPIYNRAEPVIEPLRATPYLSTASTDTLSVTPAEMEWLQSLQEMDRAIISAFNIPPLAIGESMPYDEFLQMCYGLETKDTTDITRYLKRERYLQHLSKLRPLPRRKLRKCHMRKFYAQRKQAARRYGA